MPTLFEIATSNGSLPHVDSVHSDPIKEFERLLQEQDWDALEDIKSPRWSFAISVRNAQRTIVNALLDLPEPYHTKARKDLLLAWFTYSPKPPPQALYKGLGPKVVADIREEARKTRRDHA